MIGSCDFPFWDAETFCFCPLLLLHLGINHSANMAIDRGNGTTTQLLTLLNVSATRAGKRKWLLDDMQPSQKLNKRRATVKFGDSAPEHSPESVEGKGSKDTEGENTIHDEDVAGEDQEEELEAEEDKPVEGAFQRLESSRHCYKLIRLRWYHRLI